MPDDDPAAIRTALRQAQDAFEGRLTEPLTYEEDLDPTDPETTQLRKACRLLESCRTLRKHDGYYTSVIEMSFAAIERTLEFYALTMANDTIHDFQNHADAYDRAAALGVFSTATCDALYQLYQDNRVAAYYRDTVAAEQQAEALFELAIEVHDYVKHHAQQAHECRCTTT